MSKLRRLVRSKRFRIGLLVIVVLAAGFGGWRYIENRQAAEQSEFESLIKLANSLSFQKKYDEAVTQLERYIADAPKKEYKLEATIQLGSIYLNWGKNQEALSAFQAAEGMNGPNPLAPAVGIALAAERLGDKAAAIQAYNRAIIILEPQRNEGYVAEDIRYYQEKVQALENQP